MTAARRGGRRAAGDRCIMRETVAAEVRTVNAINPAERFQAGARERLLSSDRLGWSGFGAELVGIGAGVHRVPAAAEHRVGMHIGAPVTAHCRCDGRRSSRIQSQGDVDVIPAGLDGQWADDASCTILRIAFTEEFAQRTLSRLDRRGAVARITPRLQWRDPRFQHLAWALRAELEAPFASDALYAESLGVAMIIRLADGDEDSASRSTKPALNRSAAMRVIDYIDAYLDRSLTARRAGRGCRAQRAAFQALVPADVRDARASIRGGEARRAREATASTRQASGQPGRARLRLRACEPYGALDEAHAGGDAEGGRTKRAEEITPRHKYRGFAATRALRPASP